MTGFKRISVLALAVLMVVTSVFAQGAKEDAAAGKQIELTVLNYIDMSEPNSANDITMVWDKFEAENPDIKIVREDLFNEPLHQKTDKHLSMILLTVNLNQVLLVIAHSNYKASLLQT